VQEVKTGQAVFAADGIVSLSTGATPTAQRFDFVKEMLNQVVPRKRNLVFNTTNANSPNVTPLPGNHALYESDQTRYPYQKDNTHAFLAEQGGVFEMLDTNNPKSVTSQALEIFRRNFRTGNTFYVDTLNNDVSLTMKKILKNYGSGLTNAQKAKLLYQIVEKETLVGNTELPSAPVAIITADNADVLINGTTGNTRDDTGLYELYKNAVVPFNRSVINLAESYERNANPNNAITGMQNASDAIGQWAPRTGSAQVKTNATTPLAVSYSYGGRQTLQAFNTSVSRHGAPGSAAIASTYAAYVGNIGDVPTNSLAQFPYGNIGGGNKKWPGLYRDNEYNLWAPTQQTQAQYPYYAPWQWAGIDCIGLTLHGLRYAERPEDYAAAQLLANGGDVAVPGIRIADVCVANLNATECQINNIRATTGYTPLDYTNEEKFFWNPDDNLMFYMDAGDYFTQLIHKGDAVEYGTAHISTVHSDKPTCTTTGVGTPNETTTCTYEIIHAYGGDEDGEYEYPLYDPVQPGQTVFARKVIKTWQDIKTPTGFGRIKLWD